MTEPKYAELIDAIWSLAAQPHHKSDDTFGQRTIFWTVFGGNDGGVVITVQGHPIKAWLVVHVDGTIATHIHGSRRPQFRARFHERDRPRISRGQDKAFAIVAAAVQTWIRTRQPSGAVGPEKKDDKPSGIENEG
jgi:hypothetical protein